MTSKDKHWTTADSMICIVTFVFKCSNFPNLDNGITPKHTNKWKKISLKNPENYDLYKTQQQL